MDWKPKEQQNGRALRLFIDSFDEINDCLSLLQSSQFDKIPSLARRVSIQLRKLLFDGSPLIHKVLRGPRFLPLNCRDTLPGDTYTNTFYFRVVPATGEGVPFGRPAVRTWGAVVHPLHGLSYDATRRTWKVYPMFDTGAEPMRLASWSSQRLFCVDEREYRLQETITFPAKHRGCPRGYRFERYDVGHGTRSLRPHHLLSFCSDPYRNVHI